MASSTPKLILRNCNIFADREDRVGQASEMKMPIPERKMEKMRNAGMHYEIEVQMGYEMQELEFKETAFDPRMIGLLVTPIGVLKEYMITGALVDEEDGTVTSAVCFAKGHMKKAEYDTMKPGDKAEMSYSIFPRTVRLQVGGTQVFKFDPIQIEGADGNSVTDSIRQALLIS